MIGSTTPERLQKYRPSRFQHTDEKRAQRFRFKELCEREKEQKGGLRGCFWDIGACVGMVLEKAGKGEGSIAFGYT